MEFYKKLIIRVLESSSSGSESEILKILKSGQDLSKREKERLEEIIDNII